MGMKRSGDEFAFSHKNFSFSINFKTGELINISEGGSSYNLRDQVGKLSFDIPGSPFKFEISSEGPG